MSVNDLVTALGGQTWVVVGICAALPLLAWLLGFAHGRKTERAGRWRYAYSVLVYAASVPGMFAAVITAYLLFFVRTDLREVNALVYLLPMVAMVVTLVLVRKNIEFDAIPGFDRLSGLMVLIGISFVIALAIAKTRLWILFGGSIFVLFALAGFAFVLLKWGTYALFRRGDEPKRPMPTLPDDLDAR